MAYPIKAAAAVQPGETISAATFRPALAGLVTVTVNGAGDLSHLPPRPPGEPDPPTLELRIDIYRPGSSSPATSSSAKKLNAQADPSFVFWTSATAGDADLAGDWTVKLANTGDIPVSGTVTIRYQTVPGNLGKIDHIVVLMMENRSFDHMLGYLSLPGGRTDIDGLKGTEFNDDAADTTKYPVHHLAATWFSSDPGHGWRDAKAQLTADAKAGLQSNAGFVKNFANQLAQQHEGALQPVGDVMGYCNAADVKTYDFLAKEFTVCQRWFASLPADTFPNRSYAYTGGLDRLLYDSNGLPTTPSDAAVAQSPPAYTRKTIFEYMRDHGVDWRIHFDLGIPFAMMFRALVQDSYYTQRMRWIDDLPGDDFVSRAKTGDLPPVTWIDPHFTDVPHAPGTANDDHPAGDVAGGQYLIAKIYNAIASGPAWAKTLFVVTYDEHGGFFDHVLPPGSSDPSKSDPNSPTYDPKCDPTGTAYDLQSDKPSGDGPQDDNPSFARYGLRVPAFVVSPWAGRGAVSNLPLDHTSILRTILLRFCAPVPSMGKRTDTANDLGSLLSNASVRDARPAAPAVAVGSGHAGNAAARQAPGALLRAAIFGV